eukprot:16448567-Heterocapsa_arctica.AAC.1
MAIYQLHHIQEDAYPASSRMSVPAVESCRLAARNRRNSPTHRLARRFQRVCQHRGRRRSR